MRRNRRSTRLPGHDYTQSGAYFVTLCVQNRECLFGEIHSGQIRLNDFGLIVKEEWLRAPHIRPDITLDVFVVMPNHFHGILVISPSVGATRGLPLPCESPIGYEFPKPNAKPGPRNRSLGAIIALFKSTTGRRINEIRKTPGAKVWQRNYYDHIIRHDAALVRIRRYIIFNPGKWNNDRENPDRGRTF